MKTILRSVKGCCFPTSIMRLDWPRFWLMTIEGFVLIEREYAGEFLIERSDMTIAVRLATTLRNGLNASSVAAVP